MTQSEAGADFEGWLTFLDEALGEFLDELPDDVRRQLDSSPTSLDVLEGWLLQTFPSVQALIADDARLLLDGAARYVGQTFIRHLGGHWDIDLDNPQDEHFMVPFLNDFAGQYSALSPITLVTAATDRRSGTYLRTVLENVHRRATAGSA